jgi:hypothetical protein
MLLRAGLWPADWLWYSNDIKLTAVALCVQHGITTLLTLIRAAGGVYDFQNFEEV